MKGILFVEYIRIRDVTLPYILFSGSDHILLEFALLWRLFGFICDSLLYFARRFVRTKSWKLRFATLLISKTYKRQVSSSQFMAGKRDRLRNFRLWRTQIKKFLENFLIENFSVVNYERKSSSSCRKPGDLQGLFFSLCLLQIKTLPAKRWICTRLKWFSTKCPKKSYHRLCTYCGI